MSSIQSFFNSNYSTKVRSAFISLVGLSALLIGLCVIAAACSPSFDRIWEGLVVLGQP